jgi:hypothetical protein
MSWNCNVGASRTSTPMTSSPSSVASSTSKSLNSVDRRPTASGSSRSGRRSIHDRGIETTAGMALSTTAGVTWPATRTGTAIRPCSDV